MKKVIQFTRVRWIMISLSVLLILGGLVGYFIRGGFNLGIDYTAGLTQHIQIDPQAATASIEAVRVALSAVDKMDLQSIGPAADQEFVVKIIAPPAEDSEAKSFQARQEAQIIELLADAFGRENVEVKQSDFVGPRYSQNLVGQTISIVLVALTLILLYTAFRFHFIFATAAVICLIHDVLFMAGVLAVFRLEFTTTTVAAMMTIIGYSLNDTIVIFDRVRENRGLMRDSSLQTIINTSITQSLSRTLLTSLTTLMAVLAIYIFGTGSIKSFALNLIIGVVVGTYSTVFIASPIVLGWQNVIDRRRRTKDIQKYGGKGAVVQAVAKEKEREESRSTGAAAPAQKASGAASTPATAAVSSGGKIQVTRVQQSKKKKKKKKRN